MHKAGTEVQCTTDFYKLLILPRDTNQDDIRKAHRKLVREYYPDRNPGDHSRDERFKDIQRAYEILSDADQRREYDKSLHTSSKRRSSKPRTTPGRRARNETTASSMDLSEHLSKLTSLSSERLERSREGSFQLHGEEVARLAKLLGVDVSRISELMGKDISRLSELVGENIKMNTRVNPGNARSGRSSTSGETASCVKQPGGNNDLRAKRVRGPKAQRKGNG